MKLVLRACLALLLWPVFALADDSARAWLDRDSMQLGETVTLNIEVDASMASQPDFSVLKADFNLLGTQSSRSINMRNGSTESKTVWAVGLEPKHAGQLQIPSFTIGSAVTRPLSLQVSEASADARGQPGDEIYVEASADPLLPYVQQQVLLTVKLFYAVNLTEGTLADLQIDGAVVTKLGRDKQYAASVGGRRYQVLERDYAVIPERSGSIDIGPIAFRGSVPDDSDPIGFFNRGRQVRAQSEPLHLSVRAQPDAWGNSTWLPAQSLKLIEANPVPAQVQMGEPLTRTITLRAQGLGFEQLPELEMPPIEGAEVYPDKAETQTRNDGHWLYGERTRKFAVVPSKPGKLVLPALKLSWWDTSKDQMAVAELPAQVVEVIGAATASTAAPTGATPMPEHATEPAHIVYPGAGEDTSRIWRWLALAFAALWLLTLALWWRSRRAHPVAQSSALPASLPGRDAFRRACSIGDLVGAERALIAWARAERADVRNLGELIARLEDPDQREVLDTLQRQRYAGATAEGLGARLTRAFRRGLTWTPPAATPTREALPPLYPPT